MKRSRCMHRKIQRHRTKKGKKKKWGTNTRLKVFPSQFLFSSQPNGTMKIFFQNKAKQFLLPPCLLLLTNKQNSVEGILKSQNNKTNKQNDDNNKEDEEKRRRKYFSEFEFPSRSMIFFLPSGAKMKTGNKEWNKMNKFLASSNKTNPKIVVVFLFFSFHSLFPILLRFSVRKLLFFLQTNFLRDF